MHRLVEETQALVGLSFRIHAALLSQIATTSDSNPQIENSHKPQVNLFQEVSGPTFPSSLLASLESSSSPASVSGASPSS